MFNVDDPCIINLSSAGLQQILAQCDDHCSKHSFTFNVNKSKCLFFKYNVNKKICHNADMFLRRKAIDFVQETKYLGAVINSQLKTLFDLSRSKILCTSQYDIAKL